ncbi:MAG: hypothetical protein BWY04_00757 [candidate division CPR1 bacterium ADurb.Bin160]|uniref:Uncharacterized protein n=1 Tax=candidate division CPR1 bacterium ADurb.Bin160 TaxID=1852826 RepID=A0A1V5ZMW8_9BACT|nr:MAG: hypothetical protein BWY04_00757 [candidate division CPR1 bacterium ADurb.Bin160]
MEKKGKKLNTKKLKTLQELQRIINNHILPQTQEEYKDWFKNKDNILDLFDKHPKCVYPLHMGQLVPFFPVCNKRGFHDINIIRFSLEMAKKMAEEENPEHDQEELQIVITKLQRLEKKFSLDTVPKTDDAAYRKRKITLILNKIKQYLIDNRIKEGK